MKLTTERALEAVSALHESAALGHPEPPDTPRKDQGAPVLTPRLKAIAAAPCRQSKFDRLAREDPEFPAPVNIGRRVFYDQRRLDAYFEKLIARAESERAERLRQGGGNES